MFDPKSEVPSLELCQRLKELGYPQEGGGWYWVRGEAEWGDEEELFYHPNGATMWWIQESFEWVESQGCGCCCSLIRVKEYLKAPTCRELGEWLPKLVLNKYSLYYTQVKDGWIIDYANSSNPAGDKLNWEADYTEPNARAKMIIWLRENGYIKFEEEDD